MSEPEQAQAQVKGKEEAGPSKSTASPQRLQFKQQLAGLSYDDQVQALRPQQPMSMGSEQTVQTAGGSDSSAASVKQAAASGLSGSGGSMPHLDKIQSSFGGHDVGSVKAHVGGPAESANKSMGSTAYATGNNVAFKSSPDVHTAAHEAAHVIQQRSGVSLPGGVGQSGDKYEKHADKVADRVVSGKSASDLLGGGGGSGSGVQLKASPDHIVQHAPSTGGSTAATGGDPKKLPTISFVDVAKKTMSISWKWAQAKLEDGAKLIFGDTKKPVATVVDSPNPIKVSKELEDLTGKYMKAEVSAQAGLLAQIKTKMGKLREAMAIARGDAVPLVKVRLAFEQKLMKNILAGAPSPFGNGRTAVAAMCQKAIAMLGKSVDPTITSATTIDQVFGKLDDVPEFETELKKTGVDLTKGFAGAVGKGYADIKAVFQGGNITDQIVHLNNFGEKILTPLLTTNIGTGKWFAAIVQCAKNMPTLKDKIAFLIRCGKAAREKYGQHKVLLSEYDINPEYRKAKKGKEGDMDKKHPFVPIDALDKKMVPWLAAHVGDIEITADDTEDTLLAKLKAKEYKYSGNVKDEKYFATERPKKGGGSATSILTSGGMTFSHGVAENIVDPDHSWIKTAKELEMPLKAGISGTSHRIMGLNKTLAGSTPSWVRLALLGHLQEIQAHSFHEIMAAAQGHPDCVYEQGKYVPFSPVPKDKMKEAAGQLLSEGESKAAFEQALGTKDRAEQVKRLLNITD